MVFPAFRSWAWGFSAHQIAPKTDSLTRLLIKNTENLCVVGDRCVALHI